VNSHYTLGTATRPHRPRAARVLLVIAKQNVEMNGGRIWVESMPGKGSNFQMEVPIRADVRLGNV